MNDNGAVLARSRTVRLSKRTDAALEAQAAKLGRTVSDLIRETLESEFAGQEQTAGQWVLGLARSKPDREPDKAFSAAYRKRHGT